MFRRPSPLLHAQPLAELRDIASPAAAARAGAEFGREAHFAADLLRVRPWLPADLSGHDVVSAILKSEWSGFLALIGEEGPWVYAATVRDLQLLASSYRQSEDRFWAEAAEQALAHRQAWLTRHLS